MSAPPIDFAAARARLEAAEAVTVVVLTSADLRQMQLQNEPKRRTLRDLLAECVNECGERGVAQELTD